MDSEKEKSKIEKLGFWKGLFTGIVFASVLILCITSFLESREPLAEGSSRFASRSEQETEGINFNHISQKAKYIQRLIDQYFLFDEDYEAVEDGMYKGMISGLEDPYAAYYNASELDDVMESTTGVYCGIGAVVSQNIETGVIKITRVYPDSPAEKAGMLSGDILYKVDGIEATGEDLNLLIDQHVRGEKGTSVEIEIYREATEEYMTFYPIRDIIETITVESEMLEDGIGYILISQFENVTDNQFRKAVEDLEGQGMERLMIDLRGNPGGTLDSVIGVMSYLLPDGLLFYDEDKNGSGTRYVSEEGKVYQITYSNENPEVAKQVFLEDTHVLDIPIVVLVDGYTASASEALSSALRDFEWATLVGTTTYGKGIMQTMISLGDGSMVKLTTAQYFSKSGYAIHGQGRTPDVEIEFDIKPFAEEAYSKEKDNQLQKALEVVKELD